MNAADLQARLAHAHRLLAQGDLKGAAALLEAALQAAPGEPNTLHMLAAVKQREGDQAGALLLFDEAVRRAPGAAPFHFNRANLLLEMGRCADACEGYDAAGKTGTARKPQEGGGYRDAAGNFHYISTFAGFLPAGDPKLSVIVVIDEPSTSPYAATVAAPAFAEIGRYAARTMGVSPSLAPPPPPLSRAMGS